MKPQFALKTLLIVVFAVAVILSIWCTLFRPTACIQQVDVPEEANDNFFTAGCQSKITGGSVVFRVTGRLPAHNWLDATLYTVQHGEVCHVSSIGVGTNSLMPFDYGYDVKFALCECDSSLALAVTGHRRAAGSGSLLSAQRRATNIHVLPAHISMGQAIIAYVEGDKSFVQPMMNVHEFAQKNSEGDYILVTVEIKKAGYQ